MELNFLEDLDCKPRGCTGDSRAMRRFYIDRFLEVLVGFSEGYWQVCMSLFLHWLQE